MARNSKPPTGPAPREVAPASPQPADGPGAPTSAAERRGSRQAKPAVKAPRSKTTKVAKATKATKVAKVAKVAKVQKALRKTRVAQAGKAADRACVTAAAARHRPERRERPPAAETEAPPLGHNDASVAVEDTAHDALPLDYMLTVMRDPATPESRRAEMARAAAPYFHTKAAKGEQTDTNAQSPDADAGGARKTLQRKLARLAARSGTTKIPDKPD